MRHPRDGIVLLLVSGVLTFLLLLAAMIIQFTRFQTVGTDESLAGSAAGLTARSALEYAAARLQEEPRSLSDHEKILKPENARDDWTARGQEPGGLTPARLQNPSWARGEYWRDADANGAFSGDPFDDADGNGRLTTSSGRLRCGAQASHTRYFLRIGSALARISVNSGELGSPVGDHDLDGILNRDDPQYRDDLDNGYDDDTLPLPDGIINVDDPGYAGPLGNGIPDWRDPDFFGNRHLVDILNSLGSILEIADPRTVDYAPGYPRLGQIGISSLGTRIVAGRPRGGYVSLDDLKGVLSPEEFGKAAPFLTAAGDPVPVPYPIAKWPVLATLDLHQGDMNYQAALPEPCYAFAMRIDFNRAPIEILRASLRNITATGTYKFSTTTQKLAQAPFIRLLPEEGDLIAGALAGKRPIRTWKGFLTALASPEVAAAFRDDPFTKDDPATTTIDEGNDVTGARARLKQDLVMALAAPPYFTDAHAWRANSLEIQREGGSVLDPVVGIDTTAIRQVVSRRLAGPFNIMPYDMTGIPDLVQDTDAMVRWVGSYQTPPYALEGAALGGFLVDAEGVLPRTIGEDATARIAGELSLTAGTLLLTGQQDFEMASTPLRPLSPAAPWFLKGGDLRAEGPCQAKAGIETGPQFSFASYDPTQNTGYPGTWNWIPNAWFHPRLFGDLCLAPRQWTAKELGGDGGLAGIPSPSFTLPFNADRFDAGGTPEAGTLYDASDWRDNTEDPVADPLDPSRRRGPTGFSAFKTFHGGLATGPCGPRFPMYQAAGFGTDAPKITWKAAIPFPLPREDYPGPFVAEGGKIRSGVISGWIHTRGGGVPEPESAQERALVFQYEANVFGGQHAPLPFLEIGFLSDDTVTVTTLKQGLPGTDTYTLIPGWHAPQDPSRPAGWHHIALSFDGPAGGDPDTTAVTFYFDGVAHPTVVPASFDFEYHPWNPPELHLVFWSSSISASGSYSIDDLFFYPHRLDPAEIRRQASLSRYDLGGTYVSPRFTFDEGRFPPGATIRGIDWDAFIPAQTRGGIRIAVTARDDAGNEVTETAPDWDGAQDPFRFFRIPGCRSVESRSTITTNTALALDDGTGVEVPALRDTPRIEAVAIHYTGRPHWTGMAER